MHSEILNTGKTLVAIYKPFSVLRHKGSLASGTIIYAIDLLLDVTVEV